MRKISVCICLLLLLCVLAACAGDAGGSGVYTFTGQTEVEADGRSFSLEDTPENYAEDAVIKDFMYEISGEFDKLYDVLADTEANVMSIEDLKEYVDQGVYIQSYVIHDIVTLTEEQYAQEQTSDGAGNPLLYYGWQEIVDEYELIEYEIVDAEFTMAYSEKAIEWGPQWGDGTYNQSFIVGKDAEDESYKIYDYGVMRYI